VSKGDQLLEVTDLVKHFPIKSGVIVDHEVARVRAVDGVSLTLREGETLGLVGESGCGKSTLCRAILQLTTPTSGSVRFLGEELVGRSRRDLRPLRRQMQMIFQDPFASLNPRMRVADILDEGMIALQPEVDAAARRKRIEALVDQVGLRRDALDRWPHEFSGGQRQRIAIARALAVQPRLIVCDEPTSALDVSVQAAILNLLASLQAKHRVSYILISHDLGVVRYLSDRIAVLYLGRLMQIGRADRVFEGPHHPYTEALISAIPDISGRQKSRIQLQGEIPSAVNPPSGCVFQTRCPRKLGAVCEQQEPPLTETATGEFIRCHIPVEKLNRLAE